VDLKLELKYRPQTWDQILGNNTVVQSVRNSLDRNENNTFLFVGPKGCGKTSIGRIIGQHLGIDSISEFNCSDENTIDFAREIVKKSIYKGFEGNKLFIFDECQRLTDGAQNVLLKIMEEPPDHIRLVFLTTDPQKLVPAFVSRCSNYTISKPNREDLINHLQIIAKNENIITNEETLKLIVRASENTPRDSLILLGQLKDVPIENQSELIRKTETKSSDFATICRTILTGVWDTNIAPLFKDIAFDPEGFRRFAIGYFGRVLVGQGGNKDRASRMINIMANIPVGSPAAVVISGCYTAVKTT
jgi:DNA polymerase III gamma/tau subunit